MAILAHSTELGGRLMAETRIKLEIDLGGRADLGDIAATMHDLATAASVGLRFDHQASTVAARRDLLASIGRSSFIQGYLYQLLGNGAEMVIPSYYEAGFWEPVSDRRLNYGFRRSPDLPFFEELVELHATTREMRPGPTTTDRLEYRNPLAATLITEVADSVLPLLGAGLGGGSLLMILRMIWGAGPEERAKARLTRAQAAQIEAELAAAAREVEPGLAPPPVAPAEIEALARLRQLPATVAVEEPPEAATDDLPRGRDR
jgi:hypothetical protein